MSYNFCNMNHIPLHYRSALTLFFMNKEETCFNSISDIITSFKKIDRNIKLKPTSILPKNVHYYCLNIFKKNQKIRWLLKNMIYRKNIQKKVKLISNKEDLYGDPIEYDKDDESKLLLWDHSSNHSYLFTFEDLFELFKAKLEGDVIYSPKNPYTNIDFSYTQLIVIKHFFYKHLTNEQICNSPSMTYLKWNSKKITYDHIDYLENMRTMTLDYHDTVKPDTISSVIVDSLMPVETISSTKREICKKIKTYLLWCLKYFDKYDIFPIPQNKIENYIVSTLHTEEDPGKIFREWHITNRSRFYIRSKDLGTS